MQSSVLLNFINQVTTAQSVFVWYWEASIGSFLLPLLLLLQALSMEAKVGWRRRKIPFGLPCINIPSHSNHCHKNHGSSMLLLTGNMSILFIFAGRKWQNCFCEVHQFSKEQSSFHLLTLDQPCYWMYIQQEPNVTPHNEHEPKTHAAMRRVDWLE